MEPSKLVYTAAGFLVLVTLGSCHCPATSTRVLGNCSFQYICYHDVSKAHVPLECQATNKSVDIKVILRNPTFNENTTSDAAFIRSITSFQAIGPWPFDNLTFVKHMVSLKELNLAGNNIERIMGYPLYYLYELEKVDLSRNRLSHIDTLFLQPQPRKLKTVTLAHNIIEGIPIDAFDKVTSLEELDLSHNVIRDLDSSSFGSLFRLKQLNLAFNEIDNIPDGIFVNVTSLEELDLSNNSISKLNNNTFSSLSGLKVLKLANNKIIDLDGALNSLKFLKHLYLGGNQIQNIDMQSLKMVDDLETFDVSGNNLENIASDMLARHWHYSDINSKCRIILSNNNLVSLPNATSETLIRRLEEEKNNRSLNHIQTKLDLSKNYITNIEFYAFRYILYLTSLDLSQNRLTDFVVHAEDLKHVKWLNLSNNYIRNLNYESFLLMDHIENLDLSFNQLENVPDPNFLSIKSMPMYVNMSVNNLVNVNNLRIKFHNKGGVLDLSNNSLSVVNIPQGETLRLLMLVLRSNNIEDPSLVDLRQQDELKILDMSKNYIKDLTEASLHLPPSLEYLDLTYNEISNMTPSVFKDLGDLRTLRLSHNFLNRIEYGAFQSLNNLKDLDLSYNDIQILDSKVFTDLKSLQVLSVRHNGMYYLDYKSWVGHKYVIRVNLDGNSFDCQWLAAAISDFSNGISMIEPAATEPVEFGNNLKGISCVQDAPGNYMEGLDADRTLLVMTSKILEAIREQNRIIKAQLRFHPGLEHTSSCGNEVK
ncbi:chaoptin-like [Leguminivora glycinivorella]|uniref:chaoptin-like n=1 Tax=Leguminivora glycinivorella TaxID=1035111 RepID=UPI00201080E0|nr:chaoptin-like [Leguminivora glycinivorella]XP_047997025.1 chaoptin-like [Leguminivora glycinivorella]